MLGSSRARSDCVGASHHSEGCQRGLSGSPAKRVRLNRLHGFESRTFCWAGGGRSSRDTRSENNSFARRGVIGRAVALRVLRQRQVLRQESGEAETLEAAMLIGKRAVHVHLYNDNRLVVACWG